jgi:hypothetical protein
MGETSTGATTADRAFEAPQSHMSNLDRQTRANELGEVLTRVETGDRYAYPDAQTQSRQRASLVNLPENMEDYLRAHIYTQALEDKKAREHKGTRDEKQLPTNLEIIRGEIFELLVEGDPILNTKNAAAEQFLAFMHDPARYNYERELGHVRNPDLAVIKDDWSGKMIVTEYGEAKLGRIDRRGVAQIGGGLRRGVEAGVNLLKAKSEDELKAHGLDQIAQASPVGMAEQVNQVLVVPAERNIDKPGTLFSLDIVSEYGARADEVLGRLLKESGTQVKKAAFTGAQVEALARHYLDKINQIEKGNPKFFTPEKGTRH